MPPWNADPTSRGYTWSGVEQSQRPGGGMRRGCVDMFGCASAPRPRKYACLALFHRRQGGQILSISATRAHIDYDCRYQATFFPHLSAAPDQCRESNSELNISLPSTACGGTIRRLPAGFAQDDQ